MITDTNPICREWQLDIEMGGAVRLGRTLAEFPTWKAGEHELSCIKTPSALILSFKLFQNRTPIAWLQLRHQKTQTIAAALGISFITVLLFMQIGFRSGFLDTLVDMPSRLRADIIMLNSSTVTILRTPTFSQQRLYQTLAFDEVESVTPIYSGSVSMTDPSGRPRFLRKIQVLAYPLTDESALDIPAADESIELMKRSRVFLIDELSRKEFLPAIENVENQGYQRVEINTGSNQARISIEGLFPMGANTSNDSHLLTSDSTFMDVFGRNRDRINIGLINLKPGVDHEEVRQKIEDYLPVDVRIALKDDLLAAERRHYEFNSPIGMIFRFGLGGAVIIGIVILYQILFQLVTKYVKDYATLKAIGFSTMSLRMIVLKEGLILAILGFIPGYIGSIYMYKVLAEATSLRFEMSSSVSVTVLLSVCFICLASALFAIRKLRDAEPADLFG